MLLSEEVRISPGDLISYPNGSWVLELVVAVIVEVFPGQWTQLTVMTVERNRLSTYSNELSTFFKNATIVQRAKPFAR